MDNFFKLSIWELQSQKSYKILEMETKVKARTHCLVKVFSTKSPLRSYTPPHPKPHWPYSWTLTCSWWSPPSDAGCRCWSGRGKILHPGSWTCSLYTILYYNILYTILYIVLYYTLYYTIHCNIHYTVLYLTLYLLYTVLYYTLYYTIHYTILYTVLYNTLYYTIHCTILYTILYYTL